MKNEGLRVIGYRLSVMGDGLWVMGEGLRVMGDKVSARLSQSDLNNITENIGI